MGIYNFWVNNLHDIEVNLLASAAALVVDLILTLAIIDQILKWRENKRWRPVRAIVIAQIAKTHQTFFNAAFQIGSIPRTANGHYPPFPTAQLFLNYAASEFARLRTLVDVNSVGLGSELLPDCAIFMETLEECLRRLQFLKELYNPTRGNQDLVGESLSSALVEMEAVIRRIRRTAGPSFERSLSQTPPLQSAAAITAEWETTAQSTGRLHFDAGSYACSPKMVPLVMDVGSMRKLGGMCRATTIQAFYS